MRQKLFIFLGLIFVVALLIGLNAVSYTQKDKVPDTETEANRSTYNSGATGTRAFYDLLSETGRKVTRWQQKPSALLNNSADSPQTFVIIGRTRLELQNSEIEQILKWVSLGGKLVIIDRQPPKEIVVTTANRAVSIIPSENAVDAVDPSNQQQMTDKITAGKPLQPTVFTRNINAVQPSRFASSLNIQLFDNGNSGNKQVKPTPTPAATIYHQNEQSGAPPPKSNVQPKVETQALTAPFVHISADNKNILVDVPFGSGQIVYLTDPYVVSNAGISLVDNAQLGLNLVSSRGGLIAFDEYHQGYGVSNPLFDYFEGTPAIAIFLQLALIIGVICFTNSRRFARPLPADEPNRLSKLEYISAMAQLQQSTKAYDLAVENIYTEFRRSAAKLFGVDNFTTSRETLAILIAERTAFNRDELEKLMRQCEEIIQGEPTNKRQVLELTGRLREIEEKLNLKRKRKEAFQK